MIIWLARLFIVWVAIFFVANANEVILFGWQQLVEASNEAASATTTGHAAFPPVERESRTADNALNTGKKARLQTDECDDDLLTIGLGTRGAYPSYPSSFGRSSRSEFISALSENPIHLGNNHVPFKFKGNRLFPSGVSLEKVNFQDSRSTTRREFLSDFDQTGETDASASTKHYIPLPINQPESLSESFNLGRKTQWPTLGNSATHKQDGCRGTKRKILNSWGNLLSLKPGATLDENDVQDSNATTDFPPGFPLDKPNGLSADKNCIATPQFNPQELWLFPLGNNMPSFQNAGSSIIPVFSAGVPGGMSSMARKNGENDLFSSKPPEQGENGNIWGADQGTTSSPSSRPQHSLRVEKNISVEWPRSTEPLLNQYPRPQHNFCESGSQGSSSQNPENIPQVSKMPTTHQPETIATAGNHPTQIDGIINYGRLKFNTDLFNVEGTYQLQGRYIVKLLNTIPKPYQGNFLLTYNQLLVAFGALRKKHSELISTPSMIEIGRLMDNINIWYQYWSKHAMIDLASLHQLKNLSRCPFVFPLFLIYVEMIISIIPFNQEQKLEVELNYPQEIRKAIHSYLELNTLMKNPPENGESTIRKQNQIYFTRILYNAYQSPSGILWTYIEFWMESHYTAVWNNFKQRKGLHINSDVKSFFNTIFTNGIDILNEKLRHCLPHD